MTDVRPFLKAGFCLSEELCSEENKDKGGRQAAKVEYQERKGCPRTLNTDFQIFLGLAL